MLIMELTGANKDSQRSRKYLQLFGEETIKVFEYKIVQPLFCDNFINFHIKFFLTDTHKL